MPISDGFDYSFVGSTTHGVSTVFINDFEAPYDLDSFFATLSALEVESLKFIFISNDPCNVSTILSTNTLDAIPYNDLTLVGINLLTIEEAD